MSHQTENQQQPENPELHVNHFKLDLRSHIPFFRQAVACYGIAWAIALSGYIVLGIGGPCIFLLIRAAVQQAHVGQFHAYRVCDFLLAPCWLTYYLLHGNLYAAVDLGAVLTVIAVSVVFAIRGYRKREAEYAAEIKQAFEKIFNDLDIER